MRYWFVTNGGRVAELVDAQDSKSCDRKVMRVRFSPRPPFVTMRRFTLCYVLCHGIHTHSEPVELLVEFIELFTKDKEAVIGVPIFAEDIYFQLAFAAGPAEVRDIKIIVFLFFCEGMIRIFWFWFRLSKRSLLPGLFRRRHNNGQYFSPSQILMVMSPLPETILPSGKT